MKIFDRNDTYKVEQGICLDYQNHTFIFVNKDINLSQEEIKAFTRNILHVSFFSKKGVSMFIVDVEDYLADSDLPFSMSDAPEELINDLKNDIDLSWQCILVDNNNKVVSERHGEFTKENSDFLKQRLLTLYKHPLDDYDAMYASLQSISDYELSLQSDFTQEYKK